MSNKTSLRINYKFGIKRNLKFAERNILWQSESHKLSVFLLFSPMKSVALSSIINSRKEKGVNEWQQKIYESNVLTSAAPISYTSVKVFLETFVLTYLAIFKTFKQKYNTKLFP